VLSEGVLGNNQRCEGLVFSIRGVDSRPFQESRMKCMKKTRLLRRKQYHFRSSFQGSAGLRLDEFRRADRFSTRARVFFWPYL